MSRNFLIFLISISAGIDAETELLEFCTFSYMHYGRPHTYLTIDEEALEKGVLAYDCSKPSEINGLDAASIEEFVHECRSFLLENIECAELESEIADSLKNQAQNILEGAYVNSNGMSYFQLKNK